MTVYGQRINIIKNNLVSNPDLVRYFSLKFNRSVFEVCDRFGDLVNELDPEAKDKFCCYEAWKFFGGVVKLYDELKCNCSFDLFVDFFMDGKDRPFDAVYW